MAKFVADVEFNWKASTLVSMCPPHSDTSTGQVTVQDVQSLIANFTSHWTWATLKIQKVSLHDSGNCDPPWFRVLTRCTVAGIPGHPMRTHVHRYVVNARLPHISVTCRYRGQWRGVLEAQFPSWFLHIKLLFLPLQRVLYEFSCHAKSPSSRHMLEDLMYSSVTHVGIIKCGVDPIYKNDSLEVSYSFNSQRNHSKVWSSVTYTHFRMSGTHVSSDFKETTVPILE